MKSSIKAALVGNFYPADAGVFRGTENLHRILVRSKVLGNSICNDILERAGRRSGIMVTAGKHRVIRVHRRLLFRAREYISWKACWALCNVSRRTLQTILGVAPNMTNAFATISCCEPGHGLKI